MVLLIDKLELISNPIAKLVKGNRVFNKQTCCNCRFYRF